jgi:hypothetical protein
MKIAIEEKKLVMGLYCATMLMSMLSIVDNVPLVGVMYNIKYVYMVLIVFFCFYDGVLVWNKRLAWAIGLLVIHTILYGVVFTNPYIKIETNMHFQQLMVVYILTFFSCIYVYKKNCYLLFLEMTYLALVLFMLWCALTHISNFVNPIYFVNIFSRADRFRSHFGMGDVNYCGNYCIYMLIISFFLWCEWRKQGKVIDKKLKLVLAGINVITLCMLFSTASRSAIISLALFFLCYGVLRLRYVIIRNWKLVLGVGGTLALIVVVILVATGALSSIWQESNREGNFSINYPIFLQHGDYLNGMGYMDNSGFLTKMYRYETTAMDVYFLYIPFTTGILGAAIILTQMIYLLYQMVQYSRTEGRDLVLSLFIMMLYYAIWQVNYMNYRYHTGIIHMMLLFLFLMRINEEKDVYIIKIQRR